MRSPGSRAKSVRTCQCLRPRRAVWALALSRPSVLPSVTGTTSAPGMRVLSRLNGWPMRSPVNASPIPSRASAHDFGVDAVRYSFIVMDLHHLLLAGLPAHSGLPRSTDILSVRRHVSTCQEETSPARGTDAFSRPGRPSLFRRKVTRPPLRPTMAASLNDTCKARIFFHGSGLPAVRFSRPRSPASRWSYRGAAAPLRSPAPAHCLRRFRPPRQSKHGNPR